MLHTFQRVQIQRMVNTYSMTTENDENKVTKSGLRNRLPLPHGRTKKGWLSTNHCNLILLSSHLGV